MNITSASNPNINGEYYYIRNAQGDIVGLFDKSGNIVATYIYDSWGQVISVDGSLKDTVGQLNPYRYRGYRYDNETGLYYLQSRYYNPVWGRFINADAIAGSVGELLGHNVFAYCKNNVVNMSDPSGFRPVYICEEETVKPSRPIGDNLIKAGNMVISNTTNGGLDKVTSTVASRYIDTGLTYVESGILTLGTYMEKNPIGSLIKTATGRIGVSSFIGAGVSTVSNIKRYGWTWGTAGRIGIDSVFIVGAVAVTIIVPGVGFASSVAIGVIAEGGSRATKNIIYGDNFWD